LPPPKSKGKSEAIAYVDSYVSESARAPRHPFADA
jgi:hypothetical protein